MATTRKPPAPEGPRRPPATTPEGREMQLISLATDLAEKQLRDGTASAAVVTHFLKLGSTREQLEQQKIAKELELMDAKKEVMSSSGNLEKLMGEAVDAFRRYSGQDVPDDDAFQH